MAKFTLQLCFLISFILFVSKSLSKPSFLINICSNTTMFATKSRFQTNLNTVFQYLSSNATNPSGYHEAVAGNGTNDVVYGNFLCRGDQNTSSCNNCVSTATTTDLPTTYCPNRKEAIIWYDECTVRYSNASFFGTLDQNPVYILSNVNNITGNESQFTEIMYNMMSNVARQVENGGPKKKYATGLAPYQIFTNISGLQQCIPDLSSSDCSQCLETALQSLPIKRGARTLGRSCNVRYETYHFFDGASNVTLLPPPPPSPPPSPSPLPRSNSTGIAPTITPTSGKSKSSSKVIVIVVCVVVLLPALVALAFYFITRKRNKSNDVLEQNGEDFTTLESLQYDLQTLQNATLNFSEENKLGEGGFGSVYKGTLPTGEVVAIKRLSRSSGQGAHEFKNELLLLAKLQHRNLARLYGFCLDGAEKLLVYEYASNTSLDKFIFDPIKQEQINWGMRYNIIQGIARGLLYLHQDSRLRIVHRDLKASNILLDGNMNPKISDFGMARIFGGDQSHVNTSRVVGTFGYMSPEYVMHGQFSTKSDVYSYGVLVLEIISGKQNSSFYESGYAEDLISYAWKLWQEGTPLMFVDPTIRDSCSNQEVIRCVNLGLLCVQESAEARPTIDTVVMSLDSFTTTLDIPSQPAFFTGKGFGGSNFSKKMFSQSGGNNSQSPSVNDVSISAIEPR